MFESKPAARGPGHRRHHIPTMASGFSQLMLLSAVGATVAARASARKLDAQLVTSETRDLAVFLHDKIRMTDDEIGLAAGVKSQTVRRWRSTASAHAPRNSEGLDDVRAVVILLLQSGVLYPEEVGRWLRARNADLGHARPTVMLRAGKFDAVRSAAELHVQRLNGRVLDPRRPSTLDEEIQQLLVDTAPTGQPGDDQEVKTDDCVGHWGSQDS